MSNLPDEILYDKRLIDRHIRQGLITREQADKRIEGLADAAEAGEVMDLDELRRSITGEAGNKDTEA